MFSSPYLVKIYLAENEIDWSFLILGMSVVNDQTVWQNHDELLGGIPSQLLMQASQNDIP